MTQKYKHYFISLLPLCLLALFLPVLALAQTETFVPLVPLPGLVEASTGNWQEYINTLIKISVIVAALVAVVKLILAGAQYVLADVVTNKSEAKKQIWTSLIGLLIVLSAVTVLTRINPNLATLPTLGKVTDADFSRVGERQTSPKPGLDTAILNQTKDTKMFLTPIELTSGSNRDIVANEAARKAYLKKCNAAHGGGGTVRKAIVPTEAKTYLVCTGN